MIKCKTCLNSYKHSESYSLGYIDGYFCSKSCAKIYEKEWSEMTLENKELYIKIHNDGIVKDKFYKAYGYDLCLIIKSVKVEKISANEFRVYTILSYSINKENIIAFQYSYIDFKYDMNFDYDLLNVKSYNTIYDYFLRDLDTRNKWVEAFLNPSEDEKRLYSLFRELLQVRESIVTKLRR